MGKIADDVKTYIADNILFSSNGYPHPDDASLLENGVIDSMNVLELVMFIEEKYGISVKDEDIVPDHFDSIQKLESFVQSKK